MKRLNISKWQPGLMIIEMVTTIVVSGILILGLGLSMRTILFHYQDDTVLNEVRQYGNNVMREIIEKKSAYLDLSTLITHIIFKNRSYQYDDLVTQPIHQLLQMPLTVFF